MTPFGFLARRQPHIYRLKAAITPRPVSPFRTAQLLLLARTTPKVD